MAQLVPEKSDTLQKLATGQPEPDPQKKGKKVLLFLLSSVLSSETSNDAANRRKTTWCTSKLHKTEG
jgi:hypothetical protein